MRVKCIENSTPRSDGVPGGPTGLTVGKEYEVAEVVRSGLRGTSQFSILNDSYKLARYSQSRFEVVDCGHIPSLRENFNHLTTPLRTELKALKAQLKELTQ